MTEKLQSKINQLVERQGSIRWISTKILYPLTCSQYTIWVLLAFSNDVREGKDRHQHQLGMSWGQEKRSLVRNIYYHKHSYDFYNVSKWTFIPRCKTFPAQNIFSLEVDRWAARDNPADPSNYWLACRGVWYIKSYFFVPFKIDDTQMYLSYAGHLAFLLKSENWFPNYGSDTCENCGRIYFFLWLLFLLTDCILPPSPDFGREKHSQKCPLANVCQKSHLFQYL